DSARKVEISHLVKTSLLHHRRQSSLIGKASNRIGQILIGKIVARYRLADPGEDFSEIEPEHLSENRQNRLGKFQYCGSSIRFQNPKNLLQPTNDAVQIS